MVLQSLRNALLGVVFTLSACGDEDQNLQYCPPGHEVTEISKQENVSVIAFGEPYSRNGLYNFERGFDNERVMRVSDVAVAYLYSEYARVEDFFPIFPVQVGEGERIAAYGLECRVAGERVLDTREQKRATDGGYCVGPVQVTSEYLLDAVCLKMVRVWYLATGIIDEHNLTPRFYWRLNGVQRSVPLDCTLLAVGERQAASLDFKMVYDLEQ